MNLQVTLSNYTLNHKTSKPKDLSQAKMHFVGRSADAFCAMVQGALSTGTLGSAG